MEFLGFFLTALIFIVIMVFYVLYVTRPVKVEKTESKGISTNSAQENWAEVESMMAQGGPANFRQAIVEADKLVDAVLKGKVSGDTMGERLKAARNLFGKVTYDRLWTAHKIRNKVVHEADFDGLSSDAKLAVRNFEKALKELKVI